MSAYGKRVRKTIWSNRNPTEPFGNKDTQTMPSNKKREVGRKQNVVEKAEECPRIGHLPCSPAWPLRTMICACALVYGHWELSGAILGRDVWFPLHPKPLDNPVFLLQRRCSEWTGGWGVEHMPKSQKAKARAPHSLKDSSFPFCIHRNRVHVSHHIQKVKGRGGICRWHHTWFWMLIHMWRCYGVVVLGKCHLCAAY